MTVELIHLTMTREEFQAAIQQATAAAVQAGIKTALEQMPKGEAQPEMITRKEAMRLLSLKSYKTLNYRLKSNNIKIHLTPAGDRISRADVLVVLNMKG